MTKLRTLIRYVISCLTGTKFKYDYWPCIICYIVYDVVVSMLCISVECVGCIMMSVNQECF